MKKQENEKGAKRSLITLIASTYDHFVDSNDQAIDLSGRFGHSKLSCRHWKVTSFRQIYLIHIMPARPVDVTLWRKIRPGRKKIVVKRFGLEPDIVVLEESSEGSEDTVVDDVGRVWPVARHALADDLGGQAEGGVDEEDGRVCENLQVIVVLQRFELTR